MERNYLGYIFLVIIFLPVITGCSTTRVERDMAYYTLDDVNANGMEDWQGGIVKNMGRNRFLFEDDNITLRLDAWNEKWDSGSFWELTIKNKTKRSITLDWSEARFTDFEKHENNLITPQADFELSGSLTSAFSEDELDWKIKNPEYETVVNPEDSVLVPFILGNHLVPGECGYDPDYNFKVEETSYVVECGRKIEEMPPYLSVSTIDEVHTIIGSESQLKLPIYIGRSKINYILKFKLSKITLKCIGDDKKCKQEPEEVTME